MAEKTEENSNSLLEEMKRRMHFKPKGRPPYSSAMIRYALHLRYTSLQAYKLLLENFPLPSISLLHKIQQGGVESLKSVALLRKRGEISSDCVLMVDEMYLQKGTSYQAGEYIGEDNEGNLYKGIMVFMIVGLKQSIPFVVQAVPDVTITGVWLWPKMASCIESLANVGFNVRALVTDNHSSNVTAFNLLKKEFGQPEQLFIDHPLNHENWGYYFGSKIIINIYFNNSQKLSKDSARKDVVTGFKKRQRFKL